MSMSAYPKSEHAGRVRDVASLIAASPFGALLAQPLRDEEPPMSPWGTRASFPPPAAWVERCFAYAEAFVAESERRERKAAYEDSGPAPAGNHSR
jgi:hypothetical protein